MSVFVAVLPIMLILFAGWASVATGYVKRPDWEGVETLSFRVLIPAIILDKIINSDLHARGLGHYIFALIGAIFVLGILSLGLRLVFKKSTLSNAKLTSIFQLSIRFNIFVSFAVADQIFSPEISALLAVAMAFVIPFNNISIIPVLVYFGTAKSSAVSVLKGLLSNPLVVSSVLALSLNIGEVPIPMAIMEGLHYVSRAAVGIGLLTIGAAIQIRRLMVFDGWIALSVFFKLFLSVIVFVGFAKIFTLPFEPYVAGVLMMVAPAATNGYVVAKKMGGDAEFYAYGLTWQTVLCGLSVPFWLWALGLA